MGSQITKAEYEALASFRYALRQFLRFSEEAVVGVGLTPRQHQALLAIRGFPGKDRVAISELAERLQIRHHSAVGLVDRMVAQGLVAREPATEDRRQVLVSLTPAGAGILEQLSSTHRGELRRIGPELRAQLERIVDGVEADQHESPATGDPES
ncbi:MAG: MarR family transcriptional regulator, partial [Candidatus Kapaibacterium sp.]